MKSISTLIILILFSFISTAQNSKNIPKIFHKKLLNSIAGRYAKVDVTMGYVKGTGGVNIGNPNQSQFGRFNSFSFSIYVLGRKDQQFGTITNITTESNNLNDFLIRFDWKNDRTDQGTITGEIQLFYSLSKNRYDTYFINNSNSVFKINWKTELDQIQKDSVNSLISLLFKKEFQNESEESKFNRLEEIKLEKEKELIYQKFLIEKRAYEVDKARMEMGLRPFEREEERGKRLEKAKKDSLIEADKKNKILENKRKEDSLKQLEFKRLKYKDSVLNNEYEKIKNLQPGDIVNQNVVLIDNSYINTTFFLDINCYESKNNDTQYGSQFGSVNKNFFITNYKDKIEEGWKIPNNLEYQKIKIIINNKIINDNFKKGFIFKDDCFWYFSKKALYKDYTYQIKEFEVGPTYDHKNCGNNRSEIFYLNGKWDPDKYRVCPIRYLKDIPILIIDEKKKSDSLGTLLNNELTEKYLIINNLEVFRNDLPGTMRWSDALNSGNKIGEGWRLPTKDELIILYKNKSKIGRFENNYYWTSTIESNKDVSFVDFSTGNNYTIKPLNRDKAFVRLVRTIK